MDELGADERARLYERFGRTYAAGAAIYAEGDAADLCFLVQEGRVRLVKRIRSAERSLTVLRAGGLFGEDALLAGAVRSASADDSTSTRGSMRSRTHCAPGRRRSRCRSRCARRGASRPSSAGTISPR